MDRILHAERLGPRETIRFADLPVGSIFAAAWARAQRLDRPPCAREMDRILHAERLGPRETVRFADLPEGSLFAVDGGFLLTTTGGARAWSFTGYRAARAFAPDEPVEVVTPAHVRAALAAGYRPGLHPSARAESVPAEPDRPL
jgi:hypothetical protein